MHRRTFLKTSAAALGAAGLSAVNAQAREKNADYKIFWDPAKGRPNVLFILSDQHNAKVMGHKGHPDVKTPNFDRLVTMGTRFDACTTANPICTPSRVSFLSGQYCHNHGYYGLSGPNPGGLPSVLGHFRRAGYKTAAIGKIHCPENWIENDADVFHDTCGTSIGGQSQAYQDHLAERGLTLLEDHGALREFGQKGAQTVDARPSKVSYRDGQEGWCVTRGIEFMQDCAAKGEPFFAHISLPKPHQCYTPAQEFWDLYDQKKITLPPNTDYDMAHKAPHMVGVAKSWRSGHWTLFEPKTFEAGRLRKLHGYLGCVSHVDHAVGELMTFLKESGLDKNTILVYSSDHGDYACEHDIMEKAPGISSDAITRVPFIWSWPGHIRPGRVISEVVETVDVAPTLCGLTGVAMLQTADGQDLSACLLGGELSAKDRVGVTEFAWGHSIRKGPWRYVYFPKEMFAKEYPDGFGELYNIESDPWEMTNLYFDKKYANVLAEMKAAFMDFMITKTRPTTVHSPMVKESDDPQLIVAYQHAVNRDNKIHYGQVAENKNSGYRNYL